MKKSKLIEYLQENLEEYGDGEIQVEVTSNLNFSGKVYDISDVVNTVGPDLEVDYILCFVEQKDGGE